MDKKIVATSILIAMVFVAAIAGTMVYCNGIISDGTSKVASLNSQIASLDSKVSDLKSQAANVSSQITNLFSPNIVTALGVSEIPYNSPHNYPTPLLFNHLLIMGSVANTGVSTAYNAGLHVVAYQADGKVQINMTVPLDNGANETTNENTDFAPVFGTDASTQIYGNESLRLANLYSGQKVTVVLGIFHHGTITNWTLTPVWTSNSTPNTIIPPTPTPKPFPTATTVITSVTFNNTTYDFGSGAPSEKIPDILMSVGQNSTLIIGVSDYVTLNHTVTPNTNGCEVSYSGTDKVVLLGPINNAPPVFSPFEKGLTLSWNVEAKSVGVVNPVITIRPMGSDYSFQNATLTFRVTVTR